MLLNLCFVTDVKDFTREISWLRANETEVYCERGVSRERVAATQIRGDGRHFEGVYEALCVTCWKNDPLQGLQSLHLLSDLAKSSEILIHRLYTARIRRSQL